MNFWSDARRSTSTSKSPKDHRLPFQHDFDRLLFSPPIRRMADKTQVFPLDRNDAVRTRLTHSHEVSNLARSMAMRLEHEGCQAFGAVDWRAIAAILASVGLAHDLGNPPFGHQGEAAIGNWFKNKGDAIFTPEFGDPVPSRLWPEFLEFEGNAQTLRIVTGLQVSVGEVGLDLTAATLGALIKYPVSCDRRDEKSVSTKKFGYFESEHEIYQWVKKETGLKEGQRHPLTWLMEAADDIAYSVLDIEDAIRKGIISPDDVRALIDHDLPEEYAEMNEFIDEKFRFTRSKNFSISGQREIMSSYLRTAFIQKLLDEAIGDFTADILNINSGQRQKSLMSESALLKKLKKISQEYVFVVQDVRKIEADGFKIIGGLMDFYWHAISNRKKVDDLKSRRLDARAAYGISKISDNYLECAARENRFDRDGKPLSVRYRELRLLTDMVSGMTDGFAKFEYEYLKENDFING